MAGALAGKRILVVEDEYFIASDIKQALAKADALVVGPVGSIEAALPFADEAIDAAVLDVNLRGEFSYPLAQRLGDRQIPYMFLTGYDEWSLPEDQRGAPMLPKPFMSSSVVRMLTMLVTDREPA